MFKYILREVLRQRVVIFHVKHFNSDVEILWFRRNIVGFYVKYFNYTVEILWLTLNDLRGVIKRCTEVCFHL